MPNEGTDIENIRDKATLLVKLPILVTVFFIHTIWEKDSWNYSDFWYYWSVSVWNSGLKKKIDYIKSLDCKQDSIYPEVIYPMVWRKALFAFS